MGWVEEYNIMFICMLFLRCDVYIFVNRVKRDMLSLADEIPLLILIISLHFVFDRFGVARNRLRTVCNRIHPCSHVVRKWVENRI